MKDFPAKAPAAVLVLVGLILCGCETTPPPPGPPQPPDQMAVIAAHGKDLKLGLTAGALRAFGFSLPDGNLLLTSFGGETSIQNQFFSMSFRGSSDIGVDTSGKTVNPLKLNQPTVVTTVGVYACKLGQGVATCSGPAPDKWELSGWSLKTVAAGG